MRRTIEYKGYTISQNSDHRYYVRRFNDPIKGDAMFTTEKAARQYVDNHVKEQIA